MGRHFANPRKAPRRWVSGLTSHPRIEHPLPPPPFPRALEGWSDERLVNYYALCRRMVREQGARLETLKQDLAILSRDSRSRKFWAGTGVVLLGLGLAATPVVGLAAAMLA